MTLVSSRFCPVLSSSGADSAGSYILQCTCIRAISLAWHGNSIYVHISVCFVFFLSPAGSRFPYSPDPIHFPSISLSLSLSSIFFPLSPRCTRVMMLHCSIGTIAQILIFFFTSFHPHTHELLLLLFDDFYAVFVTCRFCVLARRSRIYKLYSLAVVSVRHGVYTLTYI